jgi:hypothetical protein
VKVTSAECRTFWLQALQGSQKQTETSNFLKFNPNLVCNLGRKASGAFQVMTLRIPMWLYLLLREKQLDYGNRPGQSENPAKRAAAAKDSRTWSTEQDLLAGRG